VTEPEGATAL
jgi:transposase